MQSLIEQLKFDFVVSSEFSPFPDYLREIELLTGTCPPINTMRRHAAFQQIISD